jgi:NADH-quinone oxidoreductase subunit G
VESLDGLLVIGSNLRHEMPLLAHRVRKAVLRGAQVAFLNPRRFEYLFPLAGYAVAEDLVGGLASVVRAAAAGAERPVPAGVREAPVDDAHRSLAQALRHGERRGIFLGTLAQRHPAYAEIKALARTLSDLCGAAVGFVTEGANAAGAYLAGCVPHRESGGAPVTAAGLPARAMLDGRLKGYLLLGGIDPANDLAAAPEALDGAFVVAASSHLTESLRTSAQVVLPIGPFAETSGTFVNVEGRWQSWAGAATPVGDSRPGWKVLRVLANLLNIPGVDYVSSEEVRDALKARCGDRALPVSAVAAAAEERPAKSDGSPRLEDGNASAGAWVDIPPYQLDVLVRGSESLAKTKEGREARAVL